MRIAVAYKDGEIGEHFGHAESFAIYEFDDNDVNNASKRIVDSSALHGHKQMCDLMKQEGVDAVLSGNMGEEARAQLLSYAIVPVIGYCGDADTAADLLVRGQLPTSQAEADAYGAPAYNGFGGCGGGCGGCGGSCGGGCGEDGCGCGC